MSFERIDLATLHARATRLISWSDATSYPEIASIFATAARPSQSNKPQASSPHSLDHRQRKLVAKVKLTDQALQMLRSLNDFDREKIAEDLLSLCNNPNAPDVASHRKNGIQRLCRSRYPFKGYHYSIRFAVAGDQLLVEDLYFDHQLLGHKDHSGFERNALYQVSRQNQTRFDENFDKDRQFRAKLTESWETTNKHAVHRVETSHAAVNGMKNPLNKAAWLMGTHLDTAYREANLQQYTLFHNPSDGGPEDIYECGWDKRFANPLVRFGRNSFSSNVNHLAAVLHEAQQRGHRTDWVAHSQGAIIFARAVRLHRVMFGTPLSCHRVALHGSGTHVAGARHDCEQSGITITAVRSNPFDLVPNLAGGNMMNGSGLMRALQFYNVTIKGEDFLVSPHTLPYLGIETYHRQLLMAGDHQRAAHVRKLMVETGVRGA